MRCLIKNKQKIQYRLYKGYEEITDDNGYKTGEQGPVYGDAVDFYINIGANKGFFQGRGGSVQVADYGVLAPYEKVMVTDDMDCPIAEDSLIIYNGRTYIVIKKAVSLNSISYMVKEHAQS